MSIERELQRNYQEVFYPPMPEPEVQVAAAPTETVTDVNQPAFTMPGMGKRKQKSEVGQNLPIVAADVAAGGVKGLFSGVGGFGGDIEALYQGVKGVINRGGDERALDAFLRGMAQETILPTSDEVSKWLDKNVGPVVPADANMSPEMRKAREAGATAGEFAGQLVADPAIAIKGAKTVAKGAKALAPKAAEMVMDVTEKTGMPVRGLGIVEPDGLTAKGAKLTPDLEVPSAGDITKPAFKKWFGDSKVTDDKGEPLVVYHGGREGIYQFNNPDGKYKTGIFFSSERQVVDAFGKNGETYPVYLSIKKPFVVDAEGNAYAAIPRPKEMANYAVTEEVETDLIAEWAFKNGFDGVIVKNVLEGRGNKVGDVYIASKGTQIKSVFNKGTWNPEDPRILHGAGGLATEAGAGTMSTSQQEP